jgi:chemotaxis protein methyltransferase CheR
VANVLRAPSEGFWDIILCRNVAIYLKREASCALWAMLALRLRPGGLLVVGNAERPSVPGLNHLDRCLYRKNGDSHA